MYAHPTQKNTIIIIFHILIIGTLSCFCIKWVCHFYVESAIAHPNICSPEVVTFTYAGHFRVLIMQPSSSEQQGHTLLNVSIIHTTSSFLSLHIQLSCCVYNTGWYISCCSTLLQHIWLLSALASFLRASSHILVRLTSIYPIYLALHSTAYVPCKDESCQGVGWWTTAHVPRSMFLLISCKLLEFFLSS